MDSPLGKYYKMGRMASTKSPSWDSLTNPNYSKQLLQEKVGGMLQNMISMLELVKEDAYSFANKGEMYYQNRPELITLVEEFYLRFRSLMERNDHMTRNLQSRDRGTISDVGSKKLCRPTSFKGAPRRIRLQKKLQFGSPRFESGSDSDESSINYYFDTQSNDDDDDERWLHDDDDDDDDDDEPWLHESKVEISDAIEKEEVSKVVMMDEDNLLDRDHEYIGLNVSMIPIGDENTERSFEALNMKYNTVVQELYARVGVLDVILSFNDDEINAMRNDLHLLNERHVEMIAEIEEAHKMVVDSRSRIQELDRQVDRKKREMVLAAFAFFFFGNLAVLILIVGMVINGK